MRTKNVRKPKGGNHTQAYSTHRAGARVPGPIWGCCRLSCYCFPQIILFFVVYAYAFAWLETNIRLDLISNVCIIIPETCFCIFVISLPHWPNLSFPLIYCLNIVQISTKYKQIWITYVKHNYIHAGFFQERHLLRIPKQPSTDVGGVGRGIGV